VDPHIKIVGKMEDEVPAFFKRMRYPFAISKSALFAVGSPHTWPGLLAALVWLTDLLYYTEKAVSCPCNQLLSFAPAPDPIAMQNSAAGCQITSIASPPSSIGVDAIS